MMPRTILLASLLFGMLACDKTPAPASPPPSVSAPVAEAPSSASAPPSAPSAPAHHASAPAPSASAPPAPAEALTRRSVAALGIDYGYAAKLFPRVRALAGGGEMLESNVSADELGGDPKPGKWTFSVTLTKKPTTRLAAARADQGKEMFAVLFPDGGPTGDPEESVAIQVAGRDAYRTHTGVEGYNTDTVYVDAPGGGTLIVSCKWLGSVIMSSLDADVQLKACEDVWNSIRWK